MREYVCKSINMTKITLISLLIVIVIFSVIFIISCGPKTNKEEIVVPKVSTVTIYRQEQKTKINANELVCLILKSDTECEKIDIIIEFENPQKRTINMVYLNGEQVKNSAFSKDSNSQIVTINDYVVNKTEGDFQLTLDKFFYQTPNEQKQIPNSKRIINFLIDPVFTLTLDVSKSGISPESPTTVTFENQYLDKLRVIFESNMQEVKVNSDDGYYGKVGYSFAGWFTEPDGKGDSYEQTDLYKFNKDVTLYAHYELTCNYDLVSDDEGNEWARVTGFTKSGKKYSKVYIFDTYEGHEVREIAERAFINAEGDKEFILPPNITAIGAKAFMGAHKVTINLKEIVKIGDDAFSGVNTLTLRENRLPNSLGYIGARAFRGCVWRTVMANPDNEAAIFNKDAVLVIPTSIKFLGDEAFAYSKFREIYFWEGMNLAGSEQANNEPNPIGVGVFKGNMDLEKVYTSTRFSGATATFSHIPSEGKSGLNIIGDQWFFNCRNLVIERGKTNNSDFAEGLISIGDSAFASDGTGNSGRMSKIKSIIFPNTLQRIGKQAFNNTNLMDVQFKEIGSQFKELGEKAFMLTFIKNMTFYSLESFGPAPFYGVGTLEYLIFDVGSEAEMVKYQKHSTKLSLSPSGIEIGGHGMPRFTKIYVPNAKLDAYLDRNPQTPFAWWKNEKDKIEEKDIQPILPIESMYDNRRLSFEDLGDNKIKLTNIFSSSFQNPNEIIIPDKVSGKTVVGIGSYVVYNDAVQTVYLPNSIIKIDDNAFRDASSLFYVNWYNFGDPSHTKLSEEELKNISLEHIGRNAFKGTKIESFSSNTKLQTIKRNAFRDCKDLKSVKIVHGTNLTILPFAFAYSGNSQGTTTELWINTRILSSLSAGADDAAFIGCKSISSVYVVSPDTPYPPPEGATYTYPLGYYFLGQVTTEVVIYFETEIGYKRFLHGKRSNSFFDLGYCPWQDSEPLTGSSEKKVQVNKGSTEPN